MTILSLLFIPLVDYLYDDPELNYVIVALSPTIFIGSLTFLPRAVLLKELNFKTLTQTTVTGLLSSGVIAIVVALMGGGVWAMVVQQLLFNLIATIILWQNVNYRPKLKFSGKLLIKYLRFTAGIFLNELGGFAQSRSDVLIVGALLNPLVVGFYKIAERIIQVVNIVISESISIFVLPYVSRNKKNVEKIKDDSVFLVKVSAYLTFIALGAIGGAGESVLNLMGDEWVIASFALMFLCCMGCVEAISSSVPQFLQATGRTIQSATLPWGTTLFSVMLLLSFSIFLKPGNIGYNLAVVAMSRALAYIVFTLPMSIFYLCKVLKSGPGIFIKMLTVSLMLGALCFLFALTAQEYLQGEGVSHILRAFLILPVTGGAGLVLLMAFDRQIRFLVADVISYVTSKKHMKDKV